MLRNPQRKKNVGASKNSNFMALIPKETNPSSFARFCPIYLCNTSYKILTKSLVNRLRIIIPGLISLNQGGFV